MSGDEERSRRQQLLRRMGIDVWVRRDDPSPAVLEPPAHRVAQAREGDAGQAQWAAVESPGAAPASEIAHMEWQRLAQAVAGCTRCRLCHSRTQTVFGVGRPDADILVVGEAPGAEEDRQGEPFVGRAGQLLDNMLRALGYSRERVFIANMLKCRPPRNRDPGPDEVEACRPYLTRQIELVRPSVILALGRIAAQNLLGSDRPLRTLRQQVHTLHQRAIPVVVSYHPAYLLRSPQDKAKAWDDLKRLRELLPERAEREGTA